MTESEGMPRAIWNVRVRPARVMRSGRQAVMSTPVERDPATPGRDDPGDALKQGRLAGAVGADQRRDRAALDVEIHTVERLHAVE